MGKGKVIIIIVGILAVWYVLWLFGNIFQDKFTYTLFILTVMLIGGIIVGINLDK